VLLSERNRLQYLEIIDRYQRETGGKVFHVRHVVAWAIGQGLLSFSEEDGVAALVLQVEAALQQTTAKDKHGNNVSIYFSVQVLDEESNPPVPKTLWCHLEDASTEFLEESFAQRAKAIARRLSR
jgi:hypothetical protein